MHKKYNLNITFTAILLFCVILQLPRISRADDSSNAEKIIFDYYTEMTRALNRKRDVPKPRNHYEWLALFEIFDKTDPQIRAALEHENVKTLSEGWLREPGNEGAKILDRRKKAKAEVNSGYVRDGLTYGGVALALYLLGRLNGESKMSGEARDLQQNFSERCFDRFAPGPASLSFRFVPSAAPEYFPESVTTSHPTAKYWMGPKDDSRFRVMLEQFPDGSKPVAIYLTADSPRRGEAGKVYRVTPDTIAIWDAGKKKFVRVTSDRDTQSIISDFWIVNQFPTRLRIDFGHAGPSN